MNKPLSAKWLLYIALASMKLFFPIAGLSDEQTREAGKTTAQAFWKRVVAHPIDYDKVPDNRDAADEFWAERIVKMPDVLGDLWPKVRSLSEEQQYQAVTYYVQQFGRHGAEADFRWFLAAGEFFHPLWPGKRPSEPLPKTQLQLLRFRLMLEEAFVRYLVDSRVALARYAHLTAWLGRFLNQADFNMFLAAVRNLRGYVNDVADQRNSRGSYYWLYARYFVIMAHVTGREDLLKKADPAKLRVPMKIWVEWWLDNGGYLEPYADEARWKLNEKARVDKQPLSAEFEEYLEMVPLQHVPNKPFPDWDKDVVLPSWHVFNDLF